MLTARENMREVIRGGHPDRFANQYEAIALCFHPYSMFGTPQMERGMMNVKNAWGVVNSYPANAPGYFPVHTPESIVVKDIENWRDCVKAPPLRFSQEQWDVAAQQYAAVDRSKAWAAVFVSPGLFEQSHHLCEIKNALMYYLTDPDEMHELIKYLTEWELRLAEDICSRLKPDALFHHDDWGSEISSFMSPDMFAEFFVEPYKEIYRYYHEHGCELVIHHCDSFAANLVPHMIEMGIDVWQGCMESNDVPALVKKYGGQISFMGDIDNKSVDFTGWTDADCGKAAVRAMERCGNKYFIPCITQGGPGSLYEGTYMSLCRAIDKYNAEKFGITDPDSARMPWQLMF